MATQKELEQHAADRRPALEALVRQIRARIDRQRESLKRSEFALQAALEVLDELD